MNCQEFSEHATEIARAQVMDAAARDRALRHAEECVGCAARLERERALSAALRATAESFDAAAAPARVEAALLAAFRAGRDASREAADVLPFAPAATREHVHATATHEPVRTFSARFGRRARVAFAASAIAASLVVTFAVATRAPRPQAEPAEHVASAPSAVVQPPVAQSPVAQNGTGATSQSQTEPAARTTAGEDAARRLNDGTQGGRPRRTQRAGGGQNWKKGVGEAALAFNIDGGQAVFAEGEAVAATTGGASLRGDDAALTDFVPISAASSSAPLDGGRVVRVEAPRSALASLGLPVDARRAGEKVTADLLLAHDGTAHAIRLVR